LGQVYIDTPTTSKSSKKGKWSHLVATDLETLHEFALALGISRDRFQNKKKKGKKQPHYDVKFYLYQTAIDNGAIPITRAELLTFLQKTYYPV
jgi:hypothetical protein